MQILIISPVAIRVPKTCSLPKIGLAIGDWRVAIGDWRLASGDWRLASGDWRVAIGDWRLAIEIFWRLDFWRLGFYMFFLDFLGFFWVLPNTIICCQKTL